MQESTCGARSTRGDTCRERSTGRANLLPTVTNTEAQTSPFPFFPAHIWGGGSGCFSFPSCKDVGYPSLSSQMKGGGYMHQFLNQLLAKKKIIKRVQVCLGAELGLAQSAAGRKRVPHIFYEQLGALEAQSFQWKVTRWPQIFPCSQHSVPALGCTHHSLTPRSSSPGEGTSDSQGCWPTSLQPPDGFFCSQLWLVRAGEPGQCLGSARPEGH